MRASSLHTRSCLRVGRVGMFARYLADANCSNNGFSTLLRVEGFSFLLKWKSEQKQRTRGEARRRRAREGGDIGTDENEREDEKYITVRVLKLN